MIKSIAIALLACFLLSAILVAKDPPKVTDDSINDQVRITFANDKVIGAVPFEVNVKDGVVTVEGQDRTGVGRDEALGEIARITVENLRRVTAGQSPLEGTAV